MNGVVIITDGVTKRVYTFNAGMWTTDQAARIIKQANGINQGSRQKNYNG